MVRYQVDISWVVEAESPFEAAQILGRSSPNILNEFFKDMWVRPVEDDTPDREQEVELDEYTQ